jgi:putative glutamine amidotransferase
MSRRPIVGIPACSREAGGHPFDTVGRKYTLAVAQAADCLPVLISTAPGATTVAEVLDAVDGLLFTGALSNVHPSAYRSDESPIQPEHVDPARDALTLPLLQAAIAADVPVFAICRGFQELNVALGGTLHQAVHAVPGHADHRADYGQPVAQQYAAAHPLRLSGWFARTIGRAEILVNSLHGQGIATLAPGLVAEGWAPDGLIEAVRLERADRFVIGAQWHPEWQATENPDSLALFQAFRAACDARRSQRRRAA